MRVSEGGGTQVSFHDPMVLGIGMCVCVAWCVCVCVLVCGGVAKAYLETHRSMPLPPSPLPERLYRQQQFARADFDTGDFKPHARK